MRSVVACGVALLFLSLAVPVQAAPPSNDDRADADAHAGAFMVAPDLADATREADEPAPACTGGGDEQTVWFLYTASRDGPATANLLDLDYETPVYPSVLVLHAGSVVACAPSIGYDLYGGPVAWAAVEGEAYEVRLGGTGGLGVVRLSVAEVPGNDEQADAQPVTAPFTTRLEATLATRADDEPAPGCTSGADEQTVWYRYTAAADGRATASFAGSWVHYESYPSIVVFSEHWGTMACRPSVSIESLEEPRPTSVGFHVYGGNSYLIRLGAPGGGPAFLEFQVTESSSPLDTLNGLLDDLSGTGGEDRGLDPQMYPEDLYELPFSDSRSAAEVAFSSPYDHQCANEEDGLGWQTWYRYTATATGPLTVHLSGPDSAFLALFAEPGLDLLRCEIETLGDLVFKAHAGTTYLFAVAGPWPEAYAIDVTASGTPARYDDRADARALVEGVKYFNVAHAVREPGEPNPGVEQTLWFRYTAPEDRTLRFVADYRAPASYYPDLATTVTVWEAPDAEADRLSDHEWAVDAGRTYDVQVGTAGFGDGQYRIALTTGPPPGAVERLVPSAPVPSLAPVWDLQCDLTLCDG